MTIKAVEWTKSHIGIYTSCIKVVQRALSLPAFMLGPATLDLGYKRYPHTLCNCQFEYVFETMDKLMGLLSMQPTWMNQLESTARYWAYSGLFLSSFGSGAKDPLQDTLPVNSMDGGNLVHPPSLLREYLDWHLTGSANVPFLVLRGFWPRSVLSGRGNFLPKLLSSSNLLWKSVTIWHRTSP